MVQSALPPNTLGWVLALVLGFPLVMILLGELILRLERRKAQLAAPLEILRQWVLPSLALFIILVEVLRLQRSQVFVRLTETFLWITVIYAALTLLNVILFTGAQQDSWQAKVPQLLRDLGRLVLVGIGAAIVFSTVWGADLGGLLTALGVGSLVLGLALQDSLGNVFSGISLLFEQPIKLGDRIRLGEVQGKVIEINWRSVHILTADIDLMVVPNAELAKGTFTNLSRPTALRGNRLCFSFDYNDPPARWCSSCWRWPKRSRRCSRRHNPLPSSIPTEKPPSPTRFVSTAPTSPVACGPLRPSTPGSGMPHDARPSPCPSLPRRAPPMKPARLHPRSWAFFTGTNASPA